ncbi:MAG: DeoR/GlpR family DNA-binding transcription regulator [Clostridiaceae bacterium]
MAGEGLKIDVRRKKILELLDRDGQVRVAQLSEILGTTVVTIRSDLAALERSGYLERMPGGAIQTVKNYYNMEFQRRKQENMQYKKAIAVAASNMVSDGETLMINSGTTTFLTAVELKRHKNLNIVTNSISVAVELGAYPTFRVILLGGEINVQYSFIYGNDAMLQLKNYKADKAILSIDGINSDVGLTTYHAEEAVIDRLMMERSRQTVIVADYTKLGHESFFNIGAISGAGSWVTNDCISENQLDKIRALGIEVIKC